MTAGRVCLGLALGVVIWFFGAYYAGVVLRALPGVDAGRFGDYANSVIFPWAIIGSLVLVHRDGTRWVVELAGILAVAGLLWLPAAWAAGRLVVRLPLTPGDVALAMGGVHLALLLLALWAARRLVRRGATRWFPPGGSGARGA